MLLLNYKSRCCCFYTKWFREPPLDTAQSVGTHYHSNYVAISNVMSYSLQGMTFKFIYVLVYDVNYQRAETDLFRGLHITEAVAATKAALDTTINCRNLDYPKKYHIIWTLKMESIYSSYTSCIWKTLFFKQYAPSIKCTHSTQTKFLNISCWPPFIPFSTMTAQKLLDPFNGSYFHLISIFTPVGSPNSMNSPQPTSHQHLKPVEINYDCENDVDRLFKPSHQIPYPDTLMFLRLAKLEQQQALVKEDQTIRNHNKTSSIGNDKELDEQLPSFKHDASNPDNPCHSIMQVVLSQIEEILSDEDDRCVGSMGPESFLNRWLSACEWEYYFLNFSKKLMELYLLTANLIQKEINLTASFPTIYSYEVVSVQFEIKLSKSRKYLPCTLTFRTWYTFDLLIHGKLIEGIFPCIIWHSHFQYYRQINIIMNINI